MIARLEDAFQHNRRFIADASHELRTPLTIMRGELESIVEETHGTPEVQRTAASVLEEVERLARIVEGLFAVSRLDAGEAQKECVEFDLAALATGTAEQMCLLAEDKGISISCDAPRQVTVEGDRARMKQVVVNLLDNAIKYTSAGGEVRLSVQARDGRAVLEVADTGIGIPAEARPHIFERFFRVDKARSREMGGAGLGLSIVKSICTAHGGQVDFQSTEGAGSRFKVELPLSCTHWKRQRRKAQWKLIPSNPPVPSASPLQAKSRFLNWKWLLVSGGGDHWRDCAGIPARQHARRATRESGHRGRGQSDTRRPRPDRENFSRVSSLSGGRTAREGFRLFEADQCGLWRPGEIRPASGHA